MTADISRHSLRPLQNYTGVVRQQGRLPLDAEETEAGDIGALMLRDAIAETICEKGAPGDGFLVKSVGLTANNLLNFTLEDGSFYLGGLRCTTAVIPGSGAAKMTYQKPARLDRNGRGRAGAVPAQCGRYTHRSGLSGGLGTDRHRHRGYRAITRPPWAAPIVPPGAGG